MYAIGKIPRDQIDIIDQTIRNERRKRRLINSTRRQKGSKRSASLPALGAKTGRNLIATVIKSLNRTSSGKEMDRAGPGEERREDGWSRKTRGERRPRKPDEAGSSSSSSESAMSAGPCAPASGHQSAGRPLSQRGRSVTLDGTLSH